MPSQKNHKKLKSKNEWNNKNRTLHKENGRRTKKEKERKNQCKVKKTMQTSHRSGFSDKQ